MHASEVDCRACGYIAVKIRGTTLIGGHKYQCERCGFTSRTPGSPVNLALAVILLSGTAIGMIAYAAQDQLAFPGILAICVAFSLRRSRTPLLDEQAMRYRATPQFLDAMRSAKARAADGPQRS
mgnify:CR=1 FL=1